MGVIARNHAIFCIMPIDNARAPWYIVIGLAITMSSKEQDRNGHGTLIAAERRRRIHERALRYGSVRISELAEMLCVAENTIRNDLMVLNREGKLIRSHGGATAVSTASLVPPYSLSRSSYLKEKSWIGAAAAHLLPESGSAYIGAGSTTYELAIRIPTSSRLGIVTNCARIVAHLSGQFAGTLDMLGGRIAPESAASDASWSKDIFERLRWDICFVGVEGISFEHGITAVHVPGALNELRVFENSDRVVVLCDHSKFGRVSYARVGPVSLIDVLITDNQVSPEVVEALAEQGVEVIVAGPTEEERSGNGDSQQSRQGMAAGVGGDEQITL